MISQANIKALARGDVIRLVASALQKTNCDCTSHDVCRSCVKKEVLRKTDAKKLYSTLYKKAFAEQLDLSISGLPQAPSAERPITDPQKAFRAGKALTAELLRAIVREKSGADEADPQSIAQEVHRRLEIEVPNVHDMIKEDWERGCKSTIDEWLSKVV